MVTYSGSCPFSPYSVSGIFLNLRIFCLWTATGLVVCFGMVGCLVLVALVMRTSRPPPFFFW